MSYILSGSSKTPLRTLGRRLAVLALSTTLLTCDRARVTTHTETNDGRSAKTKPQESPSRPSEAAVDVAAEPPPLVYPIYPPGPAGHVLLPRYDKFKDNWTIASSSVRVVQPEIAGAYDIRTRPLWMELRAAVIRPSAVPPPLTASDTVMVLLTSYATDWQFLGERDLRIIADGRRYSYTTVRTSEVAPLQETLIASVPVAEFLKIAGASATEWQAGSHEFSLDANSRKTLLAFAAILLFEPTELSTTLSAQRQVSAASGAAGGSEASSEFTNRRRAVEAAEKFYIDDKARLFHVPGCVAVRPASMQLVIKAVVVMNKYSAHSCVSKQVLENDRWPDHRNNN